MLWQRQPWKQAPAALAGLAFLVTGLAADDKTPARSRTFDFAYSTTVRGLPPDKTVRIWLPVPDSSAEQDVKIAALKLPTTGKTEHTRDPMYGNKILYFEGKADAAGTIFVSATYRVTRKEVKEETPLKPEEAKMLARFLEADALVPVGGKPLTLLAGLSLPMDQLAAAKILYDRVNSHMRYSKEGTGWGLGDANWACDSRFGNCSDFHSLFISLARAHKIPAKFEIGFPLPEKRGEGDVGGYHCWALFRPEGRAWVPVDISEANKNPKMRDYYFGNLTEDRITFSTGRDLTLVPRQSSGPLNFFIYPHVEVEGKPWPAEKIDRQFSYKDRPAAAK